MSPPEQETQERPRTTWEIGKAMSALFVGGEEEATDQETPEAEATLAEDEGKTEVEETQAASDEEQNEPVEDETTSDEPFLTLNVSGQEIRVGSQEEAIALAQQGVHYSQKMEALREQDAKRTREYENVVSGLREREGQYQAALQAINSTYGMVLGNEAPDWGSEEMQTLKKDKPEEYMVLREQWDQIGVIRSELGRIESEKRQEAEKQWQGWVVKQQEALAEKRPEWTDAGRRSQDWAMIRDYATSQGITEQEMGNLYDHRFWMILHDAARYKQAEATSKTKRVTPKSKTAKPGTGSNLNQGNRAAQAARQRLKETGDPRAAGDIFQDILTRKR